MSMSSALAVCRLMMNSNAVALVLEQVGAAVDGLVPGCGEVGVVLAPLVDRSASIGRRFRGRTDCAFEGQAGVKTRFAWGKPVACAVCDGAAGLLDRVGRRQNCMPGR
jgi:hypothetical protein